MEELIRIDTDCLLAINGWHSEFFDLWMWNISSRWTWIPLYAVLVALIFYRFGWKKALWIVLAFGVCVGLSDYVSSGIIKHLVARPRPTRVEDLEGVLHIVNGYRSGRYGFVSSHAANTFSCALLFSLVWRNYRTTLPLMLWALLNCYSRMYLGVHYPGDILGGVVVGTVFALTAYLVLRKTHILPQDPRAPTWTEYAVMLTVVLTICVICFI